ncbi:MULTISPECIES: hypothetical protein [unclassified Mesorhizobium]|uniref:hypothetical protein n=1 Tax=unclassified Mesorhizobium TaxID=325217 RepID=UPI003334BE74
MRDRYFDDQLGTWVTVCPLGKASAADDIKNWGFRREKGLAGSNGRKERLAEEKWTGRTPKRQPRQKATLSIGNIGTGKSKRRRPGKKQRMKSRAAS